MQITIDLPDTLAIQIQEQIDGPYATLSEYIQHLIQQDQARKVEISEDDLEEDSIEEIREGLYIGWQQALSGNGNPVSQLWEGMDVD